MRRPRPRETQRMIWMSRNTIVVLVVVLIVIFGGYSLIG